MTIYGIGVPPLINMVIGILSNEYGTDANVMADPGDFSTAGNLRNVRRWWSVLKEPGPKFSYNPEPTKSQLLVKSCNSEKVKSVFLGTKIKITTEGRRYLEGSVVTQSLKTYTSQQKLMNGLFSWSY